MNANESTPRFSRNVERVLRDSGWYPGRSVTSELLVLKDALARDSGFELLPDVDGVLLEFNGLNVNQSGPGVTCAREPFQFDPLLAAGEEDRFKEYEEQLGAKLFPLGEAAGRHYYIAMDDHGRVFLLMDDIQFLADTFDEAIEKLVLGIQGTRIDSEI